MLITVRTYISKHQLLMEDRPVLVGLSGGADSVALLAILLRLGYTCIAAHCNFHLRGGESDRDEAFSKRFAGQLGVPFYRVDFDTTGYAEENRLSIEMAARELRYRWFEELRAGLKAQAIAVAHHRDDSVETLLINLVRGTGIRGLSGIPPRNGYVVRPLLCVGRDEIVNWLSENKLSYVTDSTNQSDIYTRNFVRLRVMPLLEEMNPSAKASIARTAEHLSAAGSIYLSVVEEARKNMVDANDRISMEALMQYPAPETILYELLQPYHFSRQVTADIFLSLTKTPGKEFYSSTHRLIKDRHYLLITPLEKEEKQTYTLVDKEGDWQEPIAISCRLEEVNDSFRIRKEIEVACMDADKLRFPLTLRRWEAGDWFIPFGMTGRKKLSDYFSDHAYSRIEKENVWLLCSGNDIAWIVGERTDNRFRITESTKQALIVKISR